MTQKLMDLFAIRLSEVEGSILAGDPEKGRAHESSFPGDLVALEAFVNHFHLEDVFDGLRLGRRARRRQALLIGERLVSVWSERLQGLLKGRSLLFYLGGESDVVLRFHVERKGSAPWMSLDDPALLKKLKVQVYRYQDGRVEGL